MAANNKCVIAARLDYHGAMFEDLNHLLSPDGLFVRGGFYPDADDHVPPLPSGIPAKTVLLIGNAGAQMWHAFARDTGAVGKNPLDTWLRPRILRAADHVRATPLFPNEGPPFAPVPDWAMAADGVHRSPIGILIHPEFGLWHVYRAALLLDRHIDLPASPAGPSPCDSCERKPCLTVCPADAFLPDRFDAAACVAHVTSNAGTNCHERGCLARRACPVGRKYAYVPDQQKFHTAAMVRAVRSGYGT